MAEASGIRNVKEVLIALNVLALVIIKNIKDGVQVSDIPAIIMQVMGSDETKAALVAAIENILAVPTEIADLSIAEGLELGGEQLKYLPLILDALRK